MKTFIRKFETTEALVTLISSGNKTTARIQKYRKDYSLPDISLSFPQVIELEEHDGARTISSKIEKAFNLNNCYDLQDWRVL